MRESTDGHAPKVLTDTLRKAAAFIEANAAADLTIAEIAEAARVTPRAVQLAFQRYWGMTPMAYLRSVRLRHARADLQRGDRESTSVTEVALRWGFHSPSRFAAYYREAFDEMPNATLRAKHQ